MNPVSNKLVDMRISVRKVREKREEEKKERRKEERKGKKKEEDGERNENKERKKAEEQGEVNRRTKEIREIEEIVSEIIEGVMKREGSKTRVEKGTDKGKGEKEGEHEKEDEEKLAKNIRELCRTYLKVMHELRDDRTRQSQVVKIWKEIMEKRKRRDKQVFHEDRRTYLLGGVPR